MLIEHFGWQTALQILGILIAVVSFPFAALVVEPPTARTASALESQSSRAAFRQASFYLITVGSMCSIAAVSGTQQNLKLFLSLDRHFNQRDAAGVLSLVLGFSIAGRLLIGWLADRFSKKYVMLLTYGLVAAGIPLLFLGSNRPLLWFSAAIFGIGLGGDYMFIPLITAEIFGTETLGRLLGVILTAGGVADAAAPWAVGYLRDSTGSYTSSCFVLIGVALLGALAVLALPERRSVQAER
jgi:cyanate permease